MMVTEIKQLFAEELTLLKKIQNYRKEQPQGELERGEKVKLLLLYRIYLNLYSSQLLTAQVLKTGKISFFSVTDRTIIIVRLKAYICVLYDMLKIWQRIQWGLGCPEN